MPYGKRHLDGSFDMVVFLFFSLNAQEIAGVFLQLVAGRQETPVARIKHFA